MSNYHAVFWFVPNLIGYARIFTLLISLVLMPYYPIFSITSYTFSCLLDALDGYAARYYNQSTQFGAVLDMVTDRCSTSCLLLQLAILYPQWLFLCQILVALDLSSHYMHMVYSSRQQKSHKEVSADTPYLMKLYYTDRTVLFWVCAGNELFFIFWYCAWWYSNYLVYTLLVLSFPVCAFKQMMNIIQLVSASKSLAEKDWNDRKSQ